MPFTWVAMLYGHIARNLIIPLKLLSVFGSFNQTKKSTHLGKRKKKSTSVKE